MKYYLANHGFCNIPKHQFPGLIFHVEIDGARDDVCVFIRNVLLRRPSIRFTPLLFWFPLSIASILVVVIIILGRAQLLNNDIFKR
jgi:hypothetical protein